MDNQSVVIYLQEKLLEWLDDVWNEYCNCDTSDFLLGQLYAYMECLEVILKSEGVDNSTMLALEEQYGIR